MNILLFATTLNNLEKRLEEIVRRGAVKTVLECYDTKSAFMDRFSRPGPALDLIVLGPGTSRELSDLISIKHLYDDSPLILVLPDRQSHTLSKGLRLFPRYVGYADGDLDHVSLVLHKMIEKISLQNKRYEMHQQ